jgi:hypothetical protein
LRFHESDIEGLLGMHFCVEGGSGGVEEEKRGLKGKGRAENREKRWRGVRKNEGNGKGRGNRSAM